MSEKVGKIEIVIKGGQPWGFRLQAKAENRSVVIVDEIVRGGRADQQGDLKVGDHVIKINGIQCLSLADALQLIESAFRTLTIVVWRTNSLSKEKPKDFVTVDQYDQMPNNASHQSYSNPQTSSIYENINFRFQEGKQKSKRFSPVENAYHVNNKNTPAVSSQLSPSNNTKVHSGKNDFYKNNLKTPYSCLDKTFKNEPEKKAMSVYNPERKLHSKTQRELHQYSNVQPLPAMNYMPEINKYERKHFPRTPKESRQYSNVHSISDSTYGKIFHISESPDPAPVPSIPVQESNTPAINHSLGQYPANDILTNSKVPDEPHSCRYPNCHNKYSNCKIHSPPERDVTYPERQSFQNDYENIDFISQPNFTPKDQNNCDSLSYEQNFEEPVLSSMSLGNQKKVYDSKSLKLEKDSVPSNPCAFPGTVRSNYKLGESVNEIVPKPNIHIKSASENTASSKWKKDSVPSYPCDFPVIKSSTSPNYKSKESVSDPIAKITSNVHAKSVGENTVSLCQFSNNVSNEKLHLQNKDDDSASQSIQDSDKFQYKSVYSQIQPMSYSMQRKESSTESLYSNRSDFPIIKSAKNPSNYKSELSSSNILNATSDSNGKSASGNSMSLYYFQNSFHEERANSQVKAGDTVGQSIKNYNMPIQPLSYSMQRKVSSCESLYSNPCDFTIIKSSKNPSNNKSEVSSSNILNATSDSNVKSIKGNSMSSLCHFQNSFHEEKANSQVKADDTVGQSIKNSNMPIQPLSYSMQRKESSSESLYSNPCDFPIIKSSKNPSNYKSEPPSSNIPNASSGSNVKSVSGNSVSSLCHFQDSFHEEKPNSQVKAGDTVGQSIKNSNMPIQPLSYSVQRKESSTDSLYSNPCDFPIIKSSNSSPNYKLELSASNIPNASSDSNVKSVSGNSVSSLCHFQNSFHEEKANSQVKAGDTAGQSIKNSNIFKYKSVYGQIKPMSYNVQEKESATECFYSSCNKPSFSRKVFSSANNTSFVKENDVFFDASNNSMCMISKEAAVVKLISSRPQQIYMDEDDELKEIDENRRKIAESFSPIHISPPLPSPPPENDSEILPYNEPLPSPPLFLSEQKQNNDNGMVETIYANLEMLKIQYSVVSSSQASALNGKYPGNYSSCAGDIATNISSAANTSHAVQSEFVETRPQVNAPFLEKVFQNQDEKMWRRVLNLPFNSAYFTTSTPKAKFLTRYTSKLQPNNLTEVKEISNEKEGLITSLRKKLDILLEEEAAVQDELRQNEELGSGLSNKLATTATQNELEKFSNHVQELEKITNLLLSLSGRLARTKNALLILPPNASAEEKMLLETKYKKLTQQYEEALHLQSDIDNRNKQVLFYLQKYLTKDELADYNHFIKMKVKLLVDYKELVEKIKLGEEQLKALTNS